MNSFNRLLSLYIDLFLIEKYYMIIIGKMLKILCFQKKCLNCSTEKKLKLTIMEKKSKFKEKRNYRVTIIFNDEVIIDRFYREDIALKTIESMKELTPSLFIAGAVEVKRKNWELIKTVSAKDKC